MTLETKDKMLQKLGELSVVFIILGTAVYFLYTDNQRYREMNDARIGRLEQQIFDCNSENISILRDEVSKGHTIIERNTETINRYFNR